MKVIRRLFWKKKEFYVYYMYNNDELLYIGKTTQLRIRLAPHFYKSVIKDDPWKSEVNKIYISKFKNYNEITEYEMFLINKLKPKYNIVYKFGNVQDYGLDIPKKSILLKGDILNGDTKIIGEKQIKLAPNNINKIKPLSYYEKYIPILNKNCNILEERKFNYYILSTYDIEGKDDKLKRLKKDIVGFFINKTEGALINRLWCCDPKLYDDLKGKGYTKAYIHPFDVVDTFNTKKDLMFSFYSGNSKNIKDLEVLLNFILKSNVLTEKINLCISSKNTLKEFKRFLNKT